MKVSVIIAAYNIQDYIDKCLTSVVKQTLTDIEIIIVNDGSTDMTLCKIEDIANRDNRIVIVNQDNKGIVEARKSGLQMARGEYVLFVDGDDWLELDALEKLYNNAKQYSSDIVLYHSFWAYDDIREKKSTFRNNDLVIRNPIKALLKGYITPSIWVKFIRRRFIQEERVEFPSDFSYGEDLAAVASLFINMPQISILDDYLYNYYQRENSITNVVSDKVLELDQAIEFIKEQLVKHDLYETYREEFEYMVYSHILESKLLIYTKKSKINHDLYKLYANRKIDIYNNKYIAEKINNSAITFKIRVRMYIRGYNLGIAYDKLRFLCKLFTWKVK